MWGGLRTGDSMGRKTAQERIAEAVKAREALDARIRELQVSEKRRVSNLEKSAAMVVGRFLVGRAKARDGEALSVFRKALATKAGDRDRELLLEVFPDLLSETGAQSAAGERIAGDGTGSESVAQAVVDQPAATEEAQAPGYPGREEIGSGGVDESATTEGGSQDEVKQNRFGSWVGNRAE